MTSDISSVSFYLTTLHTNCMICIVEHIIAKLGLGGNGVVPNYFRQQLLWASYNNVAKVQISKKV